MVTMRVRVPVLVASWLAAAFLAAPTAGMNGLEGGWPILYGAGAVAHDALGLAIEEGWYWDSERSHTTEQVAYLVFGARPRPRCGLGIELVLLIPLLMRLRGNPRRQVWSRQRTRGKGPPTEV